MLPIPTMATASRRPSEDLTCSAPPTPTILRPGARDAHAERRGEIERDYERTSGLVIVETFRERGDPLATPAVAGAQARPVHLGKTASRPLRTRGVSKWYATWGGLRIRSYSGVRARAAVLNDKALFQKSRRNAYYGRNNQDYVDYTHTQFFRRLPLPAEGGGAGRRSRRRIAGAHRSRGLRRLPRRPALCKRARHTADRAAEARRCASSMGGNFICSATARAPIKRFARRRRTAARCSTG